MSDQPAQDTGRPGETEEEKLDRNTIELLNELRVVATGIQVMFGFLLIVPFNTGFRRVSSFERTDYFVTLLCVAVSAVLLMSPSIHHRILFRHHEKPYLVRVANRLAIMAMIFLAVSLIGILLLVSDVVVGGAAPVAVGAVATVTISVLWFGLPLVRREDAHPWKAPTG
ncbi:MAG: DUF6328 family protein [Solirubrobacteraceae bacterium]